MNDDIWFTLHVGNISVDDEGRHKFPPDYSRLSQLSASNITNIAKYRETLHILLDQAIDHIASQQRPDDILHAYSARKKIDDAIHVINTIKHDGIDPYFWIPRNEEETKEIEALQRLLDLRDEDYFKFCETGLMPDKIKERKSNE